MERTLFVELCSGDSLRLDLVDREVGGQEVTVTLPSGQTVTRCFWRDSMASKVQSDEQKVTRLIAFVHERSRPAYYRALDALRPYLPRWIVHMNAFVMLGFLAVLPLSACGLYYAFGREALVFMLPISLVVIALTLGFDVPNMDASADFNSLETVAWHMMGQDSTPRV